MTNSKKLIITIFLILSINSWRFNSLKKRPKRIHHKKKEEKKDDYDLDINIDKNFVENLFINDQDFEIAQKNLFNDMLKEFRTVDFDTYLLADKKRVKKFTNFKNDNFPDFKKKHFPKIKKINHIGFNHRFLEDKENDEIAELKKNKDFIVIETHGNGKEDEAFNLKTKQFFGAALEFKQ